MRIYTSICRINFFLIYIFVCLFVCLYFNDLSRGYCIISFYNVIGLRNIRFNWVQLNSIKYVELVGFKRL